MSEFIGKKLRIRIYGESHAEEIGVVASGFPEFEPDMGELASFMDRRKASSGVFSTPRREADEPIFDGAIGGKIKGEFSAKIINGNKKSADYNELYAKPRPSHADYAWHLKDGALDFSGGGRFSGRLTAPLAVVGGIAKQILEKRGITVSAYVSAVGSVKARSYKDGVLSDKDIQNLRQGVFPSLDKKEEIIAEITGIKQESDSVGGTIECVVSGMPVGVGDNLFGGLEGKIASLVYAVPGVKGVEFGAGFDLAEMRGSVANDPLAILDGKVVLKKNDSGGINGGISNGEQITLSVVMRPTPSIGMEQSTVDLATMQNTTIKIMGRHDACIVPRAVPCIESAVAIAILDEIL